MLRFNSSNLPLQNDPNREAVAALRGYKYQILYSVLAWITLDDDDILYLEGAEDFDHINTHRATTVQIKETKGSGNITLRTKSVVEAICNY